MVKTFNNKNLYEISSVIYIKIVNLKYSMFKKWGIAE